jgi:hypothetical protein
MVVTTLPLSRSSREANVVAEQLVEKYVESIKNAPTYGDALIARANTNGLSHQQNTEVNGTKWRGQELNHSHVLDTIKTPHTFTSIMPTRLIVHVCLSLSQKISTR